MRLAIAVSRANVEHETGGPFGAVVFEVLGRWIAHGPGGAITAAS